MFGDEALKRMWPEDVPAEDAGLILEPAEPRAEGRHVPLGHVEGGVHDGLTGLLRGLLKLYTWNLFIDVFIRKVEVSYLLYVLLQSVFQICVNIREAN